MTHVFHRHCHADLPVAVAGDGPYIIDSNGKQYFDACGGAAVSCLGHSDEDVRAAIHAQVDKIAFAHTGFFTNEPVEQLADVLTAQAPGDLDHVYFLSGGSEAVEASLKLARQYFLEKGENSRRYFIARRQSYHGNTLGALAVGGNMWRREPFDSILMPGNYIDPCYAYRFQAEDESEENYGIRAAEQLRSAITELGAENVAAFICEPVVGATSGAVPAVKGYLKRIREICDENGVLLILDEIMCGMGRTGYMFACQEDDVIPDMVTVAKGLGAGYQPIGALLASAKIYQTVRDGSGFFQHGHTYMGHATACAAALAVQNKIKDMNLLSNVRSKGQQLQEALDARLGDHPNVGNIRGRGLFRGVELVADRKTKAPFEPGLKVNARIKKNAMALGLMCYPAGGTIDGQKGDHVLLAPPFIIAAEEVELVVDRLCKAIERTMDDIRGEI